MPSRHAVIPYYHYHRHQILIYYIMMTSIPTHLSVILLGNIYCFAYSLQMLTEELKKEQAAREGLKEVVATAESMLRAARAKISTLERQLKEARTMYEAAQRKQKDLENLVKNQVCLKIKRYIGYTYNCKALRKSHYLSETFVPWL